MHQGKGDKVDVIHSSYDPVDIHVRGDRAISQAFCLVSSSIVFDNGVECELACHMRLFTRLRKLPDSKEWRLLSLEASYVRDRFVTAIPGQGGRLLMSEEAKMYPRCYRRLAMVMLNRGLRPRVDLPNEDDEGSVRRIGERNRAFLNGAEG